ncbi:PREDICTED: sorting nexin-32-like [Amphimedon queenslandica]|uniref:PX domain-containing protein n=1 Tax=Amphimedon queenslandica TaxID=400682 RepID=A0A1X7VR90_AMPQE|nr:PREDICTED: sorting nexin-32-like [Amphimedon queenslandica]|eukprot:XP_003382983.1 PREDICTED: sorting nexin-32-like [Amphimedon queenslandica]
MADLDFDHEEPQEDEVEDGELSRSPSGRPRDEIIVKVTDCRKEINDWVYEMEVSINGETHTIERQYKEIQWLHKIITKNIDLGGHIAPPLPPSPSTMADLPSTAVIAKGDAMFGGLVRRHTLRLEMFLQALADQKFFADNHIVHNFLANKQLGTQEAISSNLSMMTISKAYSNLTLSVSGIQDPDEKFDTFYKYVNEMCTKLESAYERFSEFIFAWQKLGNSYVLCKAALEDVGVCDKRHITLTHIENQMAEGLFDVGVNECLLSLDAVLSLAVPLSFESSYFVHCKEMLVRRQVALQALLTANQSLDKAKPEKKDFIEQVKVKAEGEFHSLSRVAEKGVVVFTNQYCNKLKKGLQSYAEAHVAHSKRTLESLYQIKEKLLSPPVAGEEE